MSKIADTNEKIKDGVVDGNKKIEEGVVDGFEKVSDKAVEILFAKEGESVAEAKAGLNRKKAGIVPKLIRKGSPMGCFFH